MRHDIQNNNEIVAKTQTFVETKRKHHKKMQYETQPKTKCVT